MKRVTIADACAATQPLSCTKAVNCYMHRTRWICMSLIIINVYHGAFMVTTAKNQRCQVLNTTSKQTSPLSISQTGHKQNSKQLHLGNTKNDHSCVKRCNHFILALIIQTSHSWFSKRVPPFFSFYVHLLTLVEICPIVKCTDFFVYSSYHPISHQSHCISHNRILSLCGRIRGAINHIDGRA